jgi:hypothetical protein
MFSKRALEVVDLWKNPGADDSTDSVDFSKFCCKYNQVDGTSVAIYTRSCDKSTNVRFKKKICTVEKFANGALDFAIRARFLLEFPPN